MLKQIKNINLLLLYNSVFLIIFGMVALFSASIYYADELFNNPYHLIKRQFIYLIFALVVGFLVFRLSMLRIERLSIILFALTLVLLILVFIPGIGIERNGSHRWIDLRLMTFQPSELLKITMILFMANFLVRQEDKVKNSLEGLFAAAFVMFIVALLLLLETDMGAFLVIAATTLAMLFIAHAPIKAFISIILSGMIAVVAVIFLIPERLARITAFLNPWDDPYGKSYQLIQSLIAIGKGGWSGVGLGNSLQKIHFLSDAHTDFIFAIIGEELGVLGMLLVLLGFVGLIYQAIKISNRAFAKNHQYNSYVAFGIAIWFALQIFVHLGVNSGLLPTKGITLPFFSYGGSSLLVTIISIAILLRIDYENRQMA